MNKVKAKKKIFFTIFKLIVLIVSIFVFSYAWFVYEKNSYIENFAVGTLRANNIMISSSSEDGWGDSFNIDVGDGFRFNNEVTSDGVNFYKANLKDENGNPLSFTQAVVNEDYLEFDLWFKNDSSTTIFLENTSSVYPECGTEIDDLILTDNNKIDDIVRASAYGDFSRDLIAGAVRVAFIPYEYNEVSESFELKSEPVLVWAPNKNYEISEEDGWYVADINSSNSQNYKYIKVESSSFFEKDVPFLRDSIKASYVEKNSYGDIPLLSIRTESGLEKISGLKIRVWVEGNDRDAVSALKGGVFKIDLSFVGIDKKENVNTPNVSINSLYKIDGADETMEYSLDMGMNYKQYSDNITFKSDDIIYIRYKETDEYFASDYVVLSWRQL